MLELIHPMLDPALVVGGSGLGVSWWMRHTIRAPRAPEPEPLVAELQESYVEFIWRSRVAEGALPGTWLEDIRDLDTGLEGWEATIRLQPGRQSTSAAVAAADMVCSAFELAAGSVIIEPTPDQNRSRARLMVIQQSPLYSLRKWETPSLDLAGLMRLGTYADGVPAHIRFWEVGSGATNMLVAGAQGSGKSRFMSLLLAESMRATYVGPDGKRRQLVDTYLGCGQAGQSFPEWARCKALRWMATTENELIWMVWRFKQMLEERSRYLTNYEWTDEDGETCYGFDHFDPVKCGLPYAQLVIDEAAAVIGMHGMLAEWLLDIAKRGRKNGMRVVLATQSPSANELGGNSDLRAMLAAGGVVVFRVGDGNHGSMAFPSGNCGEPHEIPMVTPTGESFQGAGYVAGPDNRAGALMRTLLLENGRQEAKNAECWPIHPVDAAGGGDLLAGFWERQEARWAGEDPEPALLQRLAEQDAEAARANLANQGQVGPNVPMPAAGGDGGKPGIRVLVMNALAEANGAEVSTKELTDACRAWWSTRSVTAEISKMVDAGAIEKPRKGFYRVEPVPVPV
jgi:hypothetical protein